MMSSRFPLEGLGVADCVEGTRSVVAVPLDTPAAHMSCDTSPAIRSPMTPVCRSSNLPSETFVLRSVLKKPGKLFAENVKVRVPFPNAKECFRAITEVDMSPWGEGNACPHWFSF